MKDLKQIFEERFKYKLNKRIFRYTFLVMLYYLVFVLMSNNIYSYDDLMSYNYYYCPIVDNETLFLHNTKNICSNPFYEPFCEINKTYYGDTCAFEFVEGGTYIDLKGRQIYNPPKPNIFYLTGAKMIWFILLSGFLINDYNNRRCKKCKI